MQLKGTDVCVHGPEPQERARVGRVGSTGFLAKSILLGELEAPGIRAGRPAAPGLPPEVTHTGWDPTSGQRKSGHPYAFLSSKPLGEDSLPRSAPRSPETG